MLMRAMVGNRTGRGRQELVHRGMKELPTPRLVQLLATAGQSLNIGEESPSQPRPKPSWEFLDILALPFNPSAGGLL